MKTRKLFAIILIVMFGLFTLTGCPLLNLFNSENDTIDLTDTQPSENINSTDEIITEPNDENDMLAHDNTGEYVTTTDSNGLIIFGYTNLNVEFQDTSVVKTFTITGDLSKISGVVHPSSDMNEWTDESIDYAFETWFRENMNIPIPRIVYQNGNVQFDYELSFEESGTTWYFLYYILGLDDLPIGYVIVPVTLP